MSYVTGISGNLISAASAGWAPTNSAEVSAIASAYATGAEQVVTSLQYATSESAIVASTVTADTAVGYGAKDISADYYDYGYGPWTEYNSSKPLVQVRMTSDGNIRNYSSYPYYLYLVPYGATNNGNVSTTSQLTDALSFGEFSGGMNDFIVAEGTGSAYSQDPNYVEVTFNVTHVPFVDSEPAYWGTVPEQHYAVVDSDEYSRPVFCVAGGNYGAELFELRGNITAELDFGSIVTVSAVSGINELDIYTTGGGSADTSAVSAIASAYAESAVSGVKNTVYSYSADWNNSVKYSAFSGSNGIITSIASGNLLNPSVSALMGVGSALKTTTGVLGTAQDTASATADVGYDATVTVSGFVNDPTRLYFYDINGSLQNAILYMYSTSKLEHVSGIITASSVYSPGYDFGCTYTSMSPEALAFQSDLTGAGVDSATVSAIASAYAESAVSSKLDESATADFYTTSNPSGFIDSAYVDSAVSGKADSSALSSYALSADVSGTVDLVSTQSANWGGSALALSAGPGVRLEKVGDTLVASTDETVLWESADGRALYNGITLNESRLNFETIRLTMAMYAGNPVGYHDIPMFGINRSSSFSIQPAIPFNAQTGATFGINWLINISGNETSLSSIRSMYWGKQNCDGTTENPGTWTQGLNNAQVPIVYKVVGINRTAEA